MKTIAMDLITMTRRSVLLAFKNIDGMITAIVLPVVVLLVMVLLFGGAIDKSGHYVDYVVPGVLLSSVGQVAAGSALRMSTNKDKGVLKRFKTMPFFHPSLLFGEMIVAIIQSLLSATVLLLVATALGMHSNFTVGSLILLVVLASLFAAGISLIGMSVGIGVSAEAAAMFPTLFIFLPYLSSGFVAVNTMPNFLHGFARNMPLTPIIESFRNTITSGDQQTLPVALIWILLFLVIGSASSLVTFKNAK